MNTEQVPPSTLGAPATDGSRGAGVRQAASLGRRPAYLRPLIAVDGAGSAALGVVLLVAPGWLAAGLGLATDLPIQVFGLLFVVNGLANGRAAQRTSWGRIAPCVTIDLVFAGAMVAYVVADPWDSTGWSRWAMAALGVLSFDVGLLKLWGMRTAER